MVSINRAINRASLALTYEQDDIVQQCIYGVCCLQSLLIRFSESSHIFLVAREAFHFVTEDVEARFVQKL